VPEKLDAGIESSEMVSPEVTGGDASAGDVEGSDNEQRPKATNSALCLGFMSKSYFFKCKI
jgi:hypothetical protein